MSQSKYLPFTLLNFKSLDEQLDNVKWHFLKSKEEETVEEILTYLQLRYRTTSHVGVLIRARHVKHLRSRYAIVFFEPETDPTEIYLSMCDLPLPWDPETPKTQRNHRNNRYSAHFRRPRKRFNVDPKLKHMENNFFQGCQIKMNYLYLRKIYLTNYCQLFIKQHIC